MGKRRTSWSGCCEMCAINKGKHRAFGQRHRQPFQTKRSVGKNRRLKRHDLGDAL